MKRLANHTTPRTGALRIGLGVLAFGGLGALWGIGVLWGMPCPDWEAALAFGYLHLRTPEAWMAVVAALCAVVAMVGAWGLRGVWSSRGGAEFTAAQRWRRHLAVVASFAAGAGFLIYALKMRFTFASHPVECLVPMVLGVCALVGAQANRKGKTAFLHAILWLALTVALIGGARILRQHRMEYRSSADTAEYGARMRGEGGRYWSYQLGSPPLEALAFFLGEMPVSVTLDEVAPEDVVFADANWIVEPAVWRVTTFFNGTCVLQRKPFAPEREDHGLTRSAAYDGQSNRIAD